MALTKIFALSESLELGKMICSRLNLELGDLKVDKFSDGEISPGYEETIRNRNIFIIGSTHNSDSIVEMMLAIDAAKRSGANQINVVIPYFGYARQDRKDKHRGAIGAAAITNALKAQGANSLMTLDLHANQIEGFFDGSIVHIQGKNVFMPYLKTILNDEWIVCSPDAGGVARASSFSNKLGLGLAIMNKRRDKPNSIASMELVGDVTGKRVLIIDDMIDTAGSLAKATDILLSKGAIEVSACITHGVLSGKAKDNIDSSKLSTLYISDTIPLGKKKLSSKIKVISSADILANVINGITNKVSVNKITSVF
jgi:ribose-phosphate pyrophosphokinase